jgi:hypothetical protein
VIAELIGRVISSAHSQSAAAERPGCTGEPMRAAMTARIGLALIGPATLATAIVATAAVHAAPRAADRVPQLAAGHSGAIVVAENKKKAKKQPQQQQQRQSAPPGGGGERGS